MEIMRFKGSSKESISDEKLHLIRDEVARKYAKKLKVKLD